MKNRFLYIALALSLLVLAWLGSIYLNRNRLQLQYTREVEHTYRVIIALRNAEQFLTDAETSQRGFLLTRDEHFLAPFRSALHKTDSSLTELQILIADNAVQRVNLKLLVVAFRQRLKLLNENLLMHPGLPDFISRLNQGELIMDKIKLYVRQMEIIEYQLLDYRSREKDRYQDLNLAFIKYALIFAALVFLCSIGMIIRELRMRIRTQKMLEKSIFELRQSNEEIEQVSFAASHDLQEPLRKIRTLSTLLSKKYGDRLAPEEKDIVERIDRSTLRMHGLLENLIDFTNLVSQPEKNQPVDLDQVFTRVYTQLMVGTETALIKPAPLPEIIGFEQQLSLLFTQLLSNSLKFRHADRLLAFHLGYEVQTRSLPGKWFWQQGEVQRYHVITLRDNGIGFDDSFREKIFQMFRRLHTQSEYSGQGIGLTIARRIMTNHYGFIEADGKKDLGATFRLWFPFA